MLLPCLDERVELCMELVFGFKIRDTQAFALHDTEPLFVLIHPGAMHRWKGPNATWRLAKPLADFFAMVCTDIVTHEMNRPDLRINLPVQRGEKVDDLSLALPVIPVSIDLARTGVKGRTEMEGPCTLGLVLVPGRKVLRRGWPGGSGPRSRRQGGLLVPRHDQVLGTQRPRVEVDPFGHGGIEGGVPRLLGIKLHMRAPGFELRCRQKPASGGPRHVGHHGLGHELSREFGAIPLGEATTQPIRAFAGQGHDGEGDLGGRTALGPAARGVGESVPTRGENTLGPVADHGPLHADRLRRSGWRRPCCQQEEPLSPAGHSCRHGGRTLPPSQRLTRFGGQDHVP
jgi:hypothetical protein